MPLQLYTTDTTHRLVLGDSHAPVRLCLPIPRNLAALLLDLDRDLTPYERTRLEQSLGFALLEVAAAWQAFAASPSAAQPAEESPNAAPVC